MLSFADTLLLSTFGIEKIPEANLRKRSDMESVL